ncbi:MAG: Nuclear actin-protein involved in chromatin remodeling [Candelina submexicana]|nr:MAG: Nuclear actin-protein involved in chromatin remodeling [Candelina submexicana]
MAQATNASSERASPKPPSQIWNVREPHFEGTTPAQPDGYRHPSSANAAIVIDNGASGARAGWSFDQVPRFEIPPVMSRYRDRKFSKTYTFIGRDANIDATARGQQKNAFEAGSGIVSNWDVMEGLLDYMFLKLGVDGTEGGVGRPIVMTEPVANLGYSRRMMTEILFECYSAPSVAYGIDSLFSYNHNNGTTGLVISSSHSSTHLIPVLNHKPVLSQASRLNWGRAQSAEYLLKLLRLKYHNFPGKYTESQADEMIREHCYVSTDYEQELSGFLDWTGLEDRDHVLQYPFTEQVVVEKSQEELERIAEKRREGGRRLQEQAAKMRLEKLIRKEQELEYYKELQQRGTTETKKEFKRLLDAEDFKDEVELDKRIKELDKSIRKARTKDVGGAEEEEEEEPPTFPLLDIPDADLDEAGLRQKRHQRLMKSNVDARARAKIEKEAQKARIAEEERLDLEHRETDLEGWLEERRAARNTLLQRIKEREQLKADLGNRKSLASQMRMKNIANLASDNPSKKRRRGGDDDNFGANDDDWGVYRTIATGDQSDDDEEEDVGATLKTVEAQLLKYDPHFSEQNTLGAQQDWTKSLVHAFLRGPRPFDPESQRELHQIHLNVERIRVPEVVFQPSIAGLDQAGIVEIAAGIITQRLDEESGQRTEVLKDIFLTGGNALFQGFEERLRKELIAVLPAESPLGVRRAKDPVLDAWKGAASWAASPKMKAVAVTREEYLEKGSEYMKEHNLGNAATL